MQSWHGLHQLLHQFIEQLPPHLLDGFLELFQGSDGEIFVSSLLTLVSSLLTLASSLLTLVSSQLTLVSSLLTLVNLLNPCQFAANLCQFAANPCQMRFSPPAPAVWQSTHHAPPPPPPRLPHPWVAGVPVGTAGTQLTHTSSCPSTSLSSPTWGSVVKGEARKGIPACPGSQFAVVTAADFSALYQPWVASGLKASVNISHAAGCQVFTVSSNIPAPAVTDTTAGRRRRRHRRRRRRGCDAATAC